MKAGEDYYLEDGYLVFTREYHLKRGFCCGSGCRNCPYDAAEQAVPYPAAQRSEQQGPPKEKDATSSV